MTTTTNAIGANNDVTGKTIACLQNQNTFSAAQIVTPVVLTVGATTATNAALSNVFKVTLTQNTTLSNPTNLVVGGYYQWIIYQDAVASYTVALGAAFSPLGDAFVVDSTPSSTTILDATYDGTFLYYTFINQGSISLKNHVFVAKNGTNTVGGGDLSSPLADPFYATLNTTGSITNPKLIDVSSGTYISGSNFPLKPNISYSGTVQSIISCSAIVNLDSTWSSAAANSLVIFTDFDLNGITDLDWSLIATSGLGIKFYNCIVNSAQTYLGNSDTNTSVAAVGTNFKSSMTIDSINANFDSCNITSGLNISSTTSTATCLAYSCNINGDLTLSGANANNVTIRNSVVSGTAFIDGTHVTLTIDSSSLPQSGFTLTSGATMSQVTIVQTTPTVLTVGATTNTNAAATNIFKATLTQNTTFTAPTNLVPGRQYQWLIYQNASTAYTVGLNAIFSPLGDTFVVDSTLSSVTLLSATYDGTSLYYTFINQGSIALQNHVFVAENGVNALGGGALSAPYFDPFYATLHSSGASNPQIIDISAGNYNTVSNFPLKPDISYSGTIQTVINCIATINLDSSWSSATPSQKVIFTDINLIGTTSLNWSAITTFGLGLQFYNCLVSSAQTYTGNSDAKNFITAVATNFGSTVSIDSCNSSFESCSIPSGSRLTVSSSISTSTFYAYSCNFQGGVTLGGANANSVAIRNSAVTGTIIIDGTTTTLTIDAASYPSGGFSFSSGATISQVTVVSSGTSATANQLLYSGTNKVITGATVVNSAVLTTSSGGVPTLVAYTGSGSPVLATSPTLVTPLLGTPTSGNLANCTGYPTTGLAVLASNNAFTAQNGITPAAITSSSNATAWNLNTAPNATYAAVENTTLSAPSNPVSGNVYTLLFKQNASAAKTFAWNTIYKFPGAVVPVVSTGLSASDCFTFRYDGTNMLCIGISQNIS